jgi:pyrroline-5-carboxylate reductase
MTMTYGFIGTGTITEAIVLGMMKSPLAGKPIILSPRSHAIARALAERFPNVTVAESNQQVVDRAEVLVLAVRPQVAREVLTALTIPPSKKLISLIAATSHATLAAWTGHEASRIVRAIPLPFVAEREGVTAVFPADARAEELFNAVGSAAVCGTQEQFDLFAVTSALMGSYFGLLERLSDWLGANGMDAPQARQVLTPLFGSLAKVAQASGASFAELRGAYSTKGGLNEQVFADFDRLGGSRALFEALDRVLARARQ